MRSWLTDTATMSRFPLYTRGNADEVGPEPFPPLTWTLTWEQGAALGVADGWVHLGGFREEEFRRPVPEVFGNWGGYFYNQVSVGRVFSARMPGGSPDAIDQAYFGPGADIPPYQEHPNDQDPALSERLAQTVAWVLSTDGAPYLDDFVAQARTWIRERPDLTVLSDADLVAYGREASYRLRLTWDVYAQVVISASVGPAVVEAVTTALGRPQDAVAVFTALGGVETASTSQQVWDLSRSIRCSDALTRAFDDGVEDLLERLRKEDSSEVAAFLDGFRALLADHGHRGPNEWDLMSDSWFTRPELALGVLDRVRLQDDGHGPAERSAAGAAGRERVTAELLAAVAGDPGTAATLECGIRSGQLFYRLRELGKDTAVRVMLEAKLPFFELGQRLAARGQISHPKHVFQLLDSELDEFGRHPDTWREKLEKRAADFATLAERVPPYTVSHGIPVPPIDSWPLRSRSGSAPGETAQAGAVLRGSGVSPGIVTGRARVVFDLSEADDLQPGEILVCGTTDPSWVSLFMVAGGVICEIGAQGSHAAIVSRELGVPCVASLDAARRLITQGQLLSLDGTTGAVTLLAG